MDRITWRLIALLALALVLVIFFWAIFVGPLNRDQRECDRLWEDFAREALSAKYVWDNFTRILEQLEDQGCR